MTKIGVGIGEEFPADDTKPAKAPAGDRRTGRCGSSEDRAVRREAYRKWREQRRAWRRQWRKALHEQRNERRSDWRAWSRTFQHELHDNIVRNIHRGLSESARDDRFVVQPQWNQPLLWAILALIAIIALVSFVFANLFTIVGVVAILALIAAYYRGHDPFALEPEGQSPSPRPAAS